MQAGVVGLEMAREPRIETFRQIAAAHLIGAEVLVHHVAKLVDQPLMVGLVLRKLVVAAFPHEALLERKMGRNPFQEVAEERLDRGIGAYLCKLGIKPVDEIDELLVLVIDRLDPDTVLILPPQKGHALLPYRITNPPASGRKSITSIWPGRSAIRSLRSWSKPSARCVSRMRTATSYSPAGNTKRL